VCVPSFAEGVCRNLARVWQAAESQHRASAKRVGAMDSRHHALFTMLSSCSESPPRRLPIDCKPMALPKTGFGSAGSNKFSHGTVLCPALVSIQNASCSDLGSATALSALLERVAAEPLCCKVGWAGMQQGARELALLLVRLGHMVDVPTREPLRLTATHSGNAWLALVVAAYLQRVHGGLLHGLLVHDGKSEWVHANDVRFRETLTCALGDDRQ
jgi:hypothetical protein